VLRAGPFSDERIIRLVNRRFVPFFFDLFPMGFAVDAKAREFVTKLRPDLATLSVNTPPVLFVDADGQLLREVSNYCSSEELLAALLELLEKHPEHNQPLPEEQTATGLRAVEILMDRQQLIAAAELIEADEFAEEERERASYLRGRLACWQGDWGEAEDWFLEVTSAELLDDVRMELAWQLFDCGEFEALEKDLALFPSASNRFSEARYLYGLSLFHQERVEAAREVWKAAIRACSQDPWIYRADWAYCGTDPNTSGARVFSTNSGARTSLLQRVGYLGRKNPDLERDS
jgi:tetratricopeptide (TPR) repeat protein